MNRRKRHVLLSAKKLFIEKSFSQTSIQDILDESNISKGTFYNYFPSKNACLIAIIEDGRKETLIRREELLLNENKEDKKIFVKQIAARFQVNVDNNLLPIFEAVFYSSDPELRNFAKKHQLTELSWLASRIIHIYGTQTTYYSANLAVLLLGMIHHIMQVSIHTKDEPLAPTVITQHALTQIDAIVSSIDYNVEPLISNDIFIHSLEPFESKKVTKEEVITNLQKFSSSLDDNDSYNESQQYIDFIIDELHQLAPKKVIIKAVMKTFRQTLIHTPYEKEAQQIITNLWTYLNM